MRKIALCATASVFITLGCSSSSRSTHTASTASTSVVAAPAAFLPSDCTNQVERPSSFIIACADGGSGVEQLVWKTWGGPVAQGSGFAYANDCLPNCVAGGVHHAVAEMYVSRPRQCGRKLQYTYAVIITDTGSYAQRTTGAYNVACAGPNSAGVSRTEPEHEAPEARVAPSAPTDKEVREALREMREHEAAKKGG